MRSRYKKIITGLLILVAVFLIFFYPKNLNSKLRVSIVSNPFLERLMPLYRSLRKLPDVLFVPWTVFAKYDVETYELSISPENFQKLNEGLLNDPFGRNALDDENKVWVKADFQAGDYRERVDIRYRGNKANHWNAYKKSFMVQFPKDNLFKGMRELTLVIPTDRRFFAMSLNNYRAKKMDLIVPEEQFIHLKMNGNDYGVYISFEHWSQEWLDKQPVAGTSNILGIVDVRDTHEILPSIYSHDGLKFWKSWGAEENDFTESVRNLTEVVANATDEEFKRVIPLIINLEEFYARDTISILSGSYHMSSDYAGANNLVLLFDATEGRFRPVPYNAVLFTEEDGFGGDPSSLQKRILSISEFKKARDEYFHNYVKNNKEDDIAFTQDLIKKIKPWFYKDSAKARNNFQFYNRIAELEEAVHYHFDDPFNVISKTFESSKLEGKGMNLTGSFSHLNAAIRSPAEFAKIDPRFVLNKEGLRLLGGSYYFAENVIIPANTRLVISPGTDIWMESGASLISYSPVIAEGTAIRPIRIRGGKINSPWGVFVIFNNNEMSRFEHVVFSGGSQDVISGSLVTGMLALHNASGTIKNSQFSQAHGDDAVNIKAGGAIIEKNIFSNNDFDSIDADFLTLDSVIKNNKFVDSGGDLNGDAIDLSWSNIVVSNNIIESCSDKGISVGEKSKPVIEKNTIQNCNIGIAVKDLSRATIMQNKFVKNNVAISLYQKKPVFGGGQAILSENNFMNNKNKVVTDDKSSVQKN